MFRLPYFSKRWKWPKVILGLMIFELAGTVGALTLFGIADPDLFRTRLWQTGSDLNFNSSPSQILYAYANYRPLPKIPFVWSQTLTSFNVGISVLSTFILLCKVVMFTLHVWYPILGTVVNFILTILWCVSIAGQAGPDHSDPLHPSSVAWYVTKSCSLAAPYGNQHYCLMAKGTFAITVVMAATFLINLVLGIWSLIPNAAQKAANRIEVDDMQMRKGSPISESSDKEWEMKGLRPKVTTTPYTPRTLAFNTLDRQLPLRSTQNQSHPRWAS